MNLTGEEPFLKEGSCEMRVVESRTKQLSSGKWLLSCRDAVHCIKQCPVFKEGWVVPGSLSNLARGSAERLCRNGEKGSPQAGEPAPLLSPVGKGSWLSRTKSILVAEGLQK